MGDSPVSVQFLSDQSENFKHCENPVVNYEDPNFNISIPIFSIHGNHDDTSGFGALSALDLLSAPGLVNYFGKWEDCTSVEISPLLMCKGETYFALYGLSHLKDDRLARLFIDHNVELLVPDEHQSKWFNMLMLHQNRVDRGPKSFVTEDMLPPFLDLIIWGHEHECRIEPEYNAKHNFYVCQPGSSVATSLCEGESVRKHVATLSIYKKEFKIKPIRLNTVRPFIFASLALADCSIDLDGKFAPLKVQDYINERVEQLIDEAASQISGDSRQPIIPLIRLRVDYFDEKHMFNPIQFGLQFSGKVANPKDVVIFRKERQTAEKGKNNHFDDDMDVLKGIVNAEDQPGSIEKTMNKLIDRYFEQFAPHTDLRILSTNALQEVASRFTNANDTEALDIYTEHKRKELKKYLLKNCSDIGDIGNHILKFRKETVATGGHEIDAASASIEKHQPNKAVIKVSDSDEDTDTEVSFVPDVSSRRRKEQVVSTSKGRLTTGKERAASASTSRDKVTTGSRTRKGKVSDSDEDTDIEICFEPKGSHRGKGRAASTSRGKVTTGSRTRKGKVSDSDEDTDTEMSFEPEVSHRGKGRARGRARRGTTRGRGQKQPPSQQSIIQAFSQQSITSARKRVYDSDSSIEFPYPSD
ncbi:hypothetical protein C0J52_21737 [Blattella germanica]|nr:hypothetical protein C0J52_21737 [Blattella germanica]